MLYDLETGKPKTYRSGPNREIKFYEGPTHAPACAKGVKCPKENPSKAKDHEWSWRNVRCWQAWRRYKVDPASFRLDNFARDMFALLDQIHNSIEQSRQTESLARVITLTLTKALHG